jgi:hypothetical protein
MWNWLLVTTPQTARLAIDATKIGRRHHAHGQFTVGQDELLPRTVQKQRELRLCGTLRLRLPLESRHAVLHGNHQGASMPFPKQDGRTFTKDGIEILKPNQHGVYGVYRPDTWIYVGRGDIRTRLLDHASGGNPRITKERPTGYVTWVTSDAERIEKELIIELDPIANRKVG